MEQQKEFLTGTEEYNDAQNELWGEATEQPQYWRFTDDKRHKLLFSNWRLSKKDVPDFNDKTKTVERIEFRSIVGVDEENYEFSTISARFIKAVEPFLRDEDQLNDKVELHVKKIGTGNGVQYDVEAQEE